MFTLATQIFKRVLLYTVAWLAPVIAFNLNILFVPAEEKNSIVSAGGRTEEGRKSLQTTILLTILLLAWKSL